MGESRAREMRLTAHLISQCPQFVNCVREWELDCRGNRIPLIENLGSTEDQFDTLNLCDNEVAKLDNFPRLLRLKTLLCCNNRIARIDASVAEMLINLEALILTNNHLKHLADIDALQEAKNLHTLALTDNEITKKPYYRLYVIHKLPQLKFLDFQKIKTKDRDAAKKQFSGKAGEKLKAEIQAARTFVPGGGVAGENRLTEEQINEIKAAINKATTIDEVNRLEKALKAGQYPIQDNNA